MTTRTDRVPAALREELAAELAADPLPTKEYGERKIRGGKWTYPANTHADHTDARVAEWALRLLNCTEVPGERPTRNEVASLLNLHGPTTAMESAQRHAKASEATVLRMTRTRTNGDGEAGPAATDEAAEKAEGQDLNALAEGATVTDITPAPEAEVEAKPKRQRRSRAKATGTEG